MSFFKTPDAKHLEAKKLKTIVQKLIETVQEYDKRFTKPVGVQYR